MTIDRAPFPTRRTLIAAAAALTVTQQLGKSALADALPDASQALTRIMPQAPPTLRFTNAAGKMLTPADYAGHTLVLNFWATWCGPCVEELPSLAASAPAWARHNVLVLPVSIDLNGIEAVRPYYESHNIKTLPILLNEDGGDLRVLGAQGIPTTLIIDPAGQLVAHLVGAADWGTKGTADYLASLSHGDATGVVPVSSHFFVRK